MGRRVNRACAPQSPGQNQQRRQARVTVKYNRKELQRRLDVEKWIDCGLDELYRGRVSTLITLAQNKYCPWYLYFNRGTDKRSERSDPGTIPDWMLHRCISIINRGDCSIIISNFSGNIPVRRDPQHRRPATETLFLADPDSNNV